MPDSIATSEKILILRRLRSYLFAQRRKFHSYLELLEREEEDILSNDTEKLQAHAEIEAVIVSEIFTFQKVIDPLEDLYRKAYPEKEETVPRLKTSLESLKRKVLKKNENNRNLLKNRMAMIRSELKSLRRNIKPGSPYAARATANLVDIST